MSSTVMRIGKYDLKAVLARMPMSTIYDGWDSDIERRVAVKIIKLSTETDEETRETLIRFKRGARAAGQLNHPNIVSVHDYGETEESAYVVMEFVDGSTLKQLTDSGKRLNLGEIRRVVGSILEALQYSHDRGVVHRDIKPANIMFTKDNQVKITDFGIARLENSQLTQPGMVIGTPAYMSAEQFIGERVDWRTDIYSTGVVLYQLLTGERPFEGNLTTIMHKVLYSVAAPPSGLSPLATPALDKIVSRAMAKKPEDRFQSAADFNAALQATLSQGAPTMPRERQVSASSWGGRRPARPPVPIYSRPVVLACAAVAIALGGATAAAVYLRDGFGATQPALSQTALTGQPGNVAALPIPPVTEVATDPVTPSINTEPPPPSLADTSGSGIQSGPATDHEPDAAYSSPVLSNPDATTADPVGGKPDAAASAEATAAVGIPPRQSPAGGSGSFNRRVVEPPIRRPVSNPLRDRRRPDEKDANRPIQEASNAVGAIPPTPRGGEDHDLATTTLPPWLAQRAHPAPPSETLVAPVVYASISSSAVGLLCRSITTESAPTYGLDSARGMVVSGVTVGSAADRAGLRINDVILKIAGTEVSNLSRLQPIAAATAPGLPVLVDILRDGSRQTVQLKVDQLRH